MNNNNVYFVCANQYMSITQELKTLYRFSLISLFPH